MLAMVQLIRKTQLAQDRKLAALENQIGLLRLDVGHGSKQRETIETLARHGLTVDAHEGGPITIETVYCLGHCAVSPAALLDGHPYARLTREKIDVLVAKAKGRPQ